MLPGLASQVLGPFRDLISGPLAEPSFDAQESLKVFLTYQDADLADDDESPWFSEFPEDLKLEHALETYLLLNTHKSAN